MILMLDVVQEHACSYLPDRVARMRYRLMPDCPPATYEKLVSRGWRRFGATLFRPTCRRCDECLGLRLDVATFEPNRSQRRALRRNTDLTIVLRRASISDEHLDLYDRYHTDMAERRGWEEKVFDAEGYHATFVAGGDPFAHELLYYDGTRLLGVALVDILPSSLSAVYCYYDPAERQRGIGVFSVLAQVELARQYGIPYVYLGYWIEENRSMAYKSRYRPHQILAGRPRLEEEPDWRDGDEYRAWRESDETTSDRPVLVEAAG
ncbi:MAG: arginyltransferase [Thermoanaerobaculia bacterium]|nr:arginyltransferase [Thermoanaerobaculia bacterium]